MKNCLGFDVEPLLGASALSGVVVERHYGVRKLGGSRVSPRLGKAVVDP